MNISTARARAGRTLKIWTPEDKAFWRREGEAVAKLNLWISVPALFFAFVIWQMWSVVAVSFPEDRGRTSHSSSTPVSRGGPCLKHTDAT